MATRDEITTSMLDDEKEAKKAEKKAKKEAKKAEKQAKKEAEKEEKDRKARQKKLQEDMKAGRVTIPVEVDYERLQQDMDRFTEEMRQSAHKSVEEWMYRRGEQALNESIRRSEKKLIDVSDRERFAALDAAAKNAKEAEGNAERALKKAKEANDKKLIQKAEAEAKQAKKMAKQAKELAEAEAENLNIANQYKQQAVVLKSESAALAKETAKTNGDAAVSLKKAQKAAEEKLNKERLDKLHANANLAFEVIGRFESIKLSASKDPYTGGYDIAFGNTTKPDGTPVKSGDKISSVEELREYYDSYCEKNIYPKMAKYLHVENMTPEQIVAIQSLMYNAGAGVLEKNLNFVKDFNAYVDTGDKEALENVNAFLDKKIYSRNQKTNELKVVPALIARRDLEERLIEGRISLTDPTHENYVDIENVSMGAVYVLSGKNENVVRNNVQTTTDSKLCDKINECQGDSLQMKMNKLAETSLTVPIKGRKGRG